MIDLAANHASWNSLSNFCSTLIYDNCIFNIRAILIKIDMLDREELKPF